MASDEQAFEIIPGPAASPLIFCCDHASNALPAAYGDLGLEPAQFQRHIAYDIGAAAMTRALAGLFDAPALLGRWTRLLIDLNRGPDDPTIVMRLSDGALIPGNARAGEAEFRRRIAQFHAPYHAALTAAIDAALAAGVAPTLVSMHSFTPAWRNVPRPWHVGVLWDRDARLARPLLAAFEAEGDLVVGDNEPYHGALEGDTMWTHGTMRGLPHALIEIRQDLIAEPEGVARMSGIVARALRRALAEMAASA
ncbi:MAG: N-formylglutamate amidohydrolase [Alphaproteobacteria bacterium]|nr:N-formylglutamate amidohydrolase [Alphaproteobacteria bacterium]